MKILNIDALVEPKRFLKFKGESYPVNEISVQDFIDSLDAIQKAEEAEASGALSPAAVKAAVEEARNSILKAVPTLPREELNKLPLGALSVIAAFIRGDLDETALSPTPAAAEEGDAAPKKD